MGLEAGPAGLITGGLQGALGIAQTIGGLIGAKKAQRKLENLKTPTTTSDSAVSDYYDQARNPFNSLEYQMQKQNAGAGVAQGLSAFQDRRSGLAGIGGLIRQRNNSLLASAANAQSRLGQATQMKAQDNQRVFGINKMLPYENKRALLAAKASGGNQTASAGLSNIFGGLQTAGAGYMYGNNNSTYTDPNYNPNSISGRYPSATRV